MAAIKITPEEFLDLLDRYNTNVKGKSRKDLEAANEDLRNRIAQVAADKKFRGTGITPNLEKFKPDSFNTLLDWGEKSNQIANTMDALQYSSSLDNGTAYPEDKLRAFADFMYKLNISAEDMNDVTSDPAKIADIFNYYTQYGIPIVSTSRGYTGGANPTYVDYSRDIYSRGGIPTFEHYAKSRILNNPSDFGKQVQKAYKPRAVQPGTPAEIQETEISPVEEAVQNTPSTVTPDTQELSNADWLADELRKSYKKDPRGFERLGTW